MAALEAREVAVSGTDAACIVLPVLAPMLADTRAAKIAIELRFEHLVERPPLHLMLNTIPEMGNWTELRILTEASGKYFATAGNLASSEGLSPVTWQSGTASRGDHSSH